MIDFCTYFRSGATFDALARAGRVDDLAEAFGRLPQGCEAPPDGAAEHVGRLVESLDRHRVQLAVALAGSPEDVAPLAEAAALSRGRLVPVLPVDPRAPGAAREVERRVGPGDFQGIALAPGRDGYRMSEGAADAVLDVLGGTGGVCFVECGVPDRTLERAFRATHRFDPGAACPLELLTPAERHPGVTFVAMGLGGGMLRELLLVAQAAPNVCAETSGVERWHRALPHSAGMVDVLERALDVLGPERLLFGTGSGFPEPAWRHASLVHQREALGACGLGQEERELVFSGNARRLLGLPAPERSRAGSKAT